MNAERFKSFLMTYDFGYKTPCEVWTRAQHRDGYGSLWVNGRSLLAHRYAWILFNGPIPEGHEVCHHCDNPPCCRVDHLFADSHTGNMRDAFAKGRGFIAHVEKSGMAKLTNAQVLQMREMHARGASYKLLQETFGIGESHVWQIVSRRIWKHI